MEGYYNFYRLIGISRFYNVYVTQYVCEALILYTDAKLEYNSFTHVNKKVFYFQFYNART